MEKLLFVSKDNYPKVRDMLMGNDLLSKQSIDFRDNIALGLKKNGYYLKISGSEEAMEMADKLLKGHVDEVKGKEKEDVLRKFNEQDENAMQGFGNIFG